MFKRVDTNLATEQAYQEKSMILKPCPPDQQQQHFWEPVINAYYWVHLILLESETGDASKPVINVFYKLSKYLSRTLPGGFPGVAQMVKYLLCNAEDLGLSWSGRSHGEGNGNTQYFCPGKFQMAGEPGRLGSSWGLQIGTRLSNSLSLSLSSLQ